MKKKEKHKWDETLVISVMVVAALSILIILASYITVTGKAYSSIPTKESVLNILNKATVASPGEVSFCDYECSNSGSACILSKDSNNQIHNCKSFISAPDCLCAKSNPK
jgi:hypothetical protein